MNAVVRFATWLALESLRRLAARTRPQRDASDLDQDEAWEHVLGRWSNDLCGLLNSLTRGELATIARAEQLAIDGRSDELRGRLWERGAALERCGVDVGALLQPRPVILGGHLVIQAPPRGLYPPSELWPRPVPPVTTAAPPDDEPDDLDELLAAADRAIGVRLGRRGPDKGAWGIRAAALVGVTERGGGEPDWRGDVEIKTVPVARDRSRLWRIVEDPAIAMVDGGGTLAKLQRTLWLARADLADGDATIVSWYLLDWDPVVARLAHRDLHQRPKGPAGTDQRAVYLHKRFFADAGLLATLNGGPS